MAVVAVSSAYRTAPRELLDQPEFVNAAARVDFDGTPPELLAIAKRIEHTLGRGPGVRFGPRPIDIDLLLWSGGAWHDTQLTIPHPRLLERRFALVPLLEVADTCAVDVWDELRRAAARLAADRDQRVERLEGVALWPPVPGD